MLEEEGKKKIKKNTYDNMLLLKIIWEKLNF
jgi:hypothetical protein